MPSTRTANSQMWAKTKVLLWMNLLLWKNTNIPLLLMCTFLGPREEPQPLCRALIGLHRMHEWSHPSSWPSLAANYPPKCKQTGIFAGINSCGLHVCGWLNWQLCKAAFPSLYDEPLTNKWFKIKTKLYSECIQTLTNEYKSDHLFWYSRKKIGFQCNSFGNIWKISFCRRV